MTPAANSRIGQASVVLGLSIILASIAFTQPLIFVRGRNPRTLVSWLEQGFDEPVAGHPVAMLFLLFTVIGIKLWRCKSSIPVTRGPIGWLIGFGVCLVLFCAGIILAQKDGFTGRMFCLPAIPLMAGCGTGWIAGKAWIKKLWIGALLLFLVLPPPPLISLHLRSKQMLQSWMGTDWNNGHGQLQRWFGSDVLREWVSAIHILEDLPSTFTIFFITGLMCWIIPRRPWVKTGLLLLASVLSFLEMTFHTGC